MRKGMKAAFVVLALGLAGCGGGSNPSNPFPAFPSQIALLPSNGSYDCIVVNQARGISVDFSASSGGTDYNTQPICNAIVAAKHYGWTEFPQFPYAWILANSTKPVCRASASSITAGVAQRSGSDAQAACDGLATDGWNVKPYRGPINQQSTGSSS